MSPQEAHTMAVCPTRPQAGQALSRQQRHWGSGCLPAREQDRRPWGGSPRGGTGGHRSPDWEICTAAGSPTGRRTTPHSAAAAREAAGLLPPMSKLVHGQENYPLCCCCPNGSGVCPAHVSRTGGNLHHGHVMRRPASWPALLLVRCC